MDFENFASAEKTLNSILRSQHNRRVHGRHAWDSRPHHQSGRAPRENGAGMDHSGHVRFKDTCGSRLSLQPGSSTGFSTCCIPGGTTGISKGAMLTHSNIPARMWSRCIPGWRVAFRNKEQAEGAEFVCALPLITSSRLLPGIKLGAQRQSARYCWLRQELKSPFHIFGPQHSFQWPLLE